MKKRTKKEQAIRLAWAKEYLDYCFHCGVDEADYDGMTDEEIIEKANYLEDKADAAYEARKERDI